MSRHKYVSVVNIIIHIYTWAKYVPFNSGNDVDTQRPKCCARDVRLHIIMITKMEVNPDNMLNREM